MAKKIREKDDIAETSDIDYSPTTPSTPTTPDKQAAPHNNNVRTTTHHPPYPHHYPNYKNASLHSGPAVPGGPFPPPKMSTRGVVHDQGVMMRHRPLVGSVGDSWEGSYGHAYT